MSNYNPQGGGLQYRGTKAQSPPNVFTDTRAPTEFDTQGFSLGDLWVYVNTATQTNLVYILISLYGSAAAKRSLATWVQFTGIDLGAETLNGVAYGAGPGNPIQWTAQGGTNTVLAANNGAPFFTSHPTVTEVTITGPVTNPTDAATKAYVDAIAAGFTFIAAVNVATIANLTATYNNGTAGVGATLTNSGAQAALVIDGVSVSPGDRVLIKNQSTQAQNGIYTVTNIGSGSSNWILTRATDYDLAPSQIKPGNIVPVTSGTTNASTLWLQTATVTTIGTDSIIFVPFGIEPVIPLPIAEGGTNATSFANTDGVVYFDGTRLVDTTAGTAGQILTSNGAGMAPTFQNNVLPDYSTGTWTPVLTFGGSNAGMVFNLQEGNYTQIGNVIYYTWAIIITSKGTSIGTAVVTGPPFNSGGTGTNSIMMGPVATYQLSFPLGYTFPWLFQVISTNTWEIHAGGSGLIQVTLNDTNFNNNTLLSATGFYFTS